MSDTWFAGRQKESSWVGPFNTKDEAIAAAKEFIRDGERGFIGRETDITVGISGRQVIENLAEEASWELPDEHHWLKDVSDDEVSQLEAGLNCVLEHWMDKYGYAPPPIIGSVEEVHE